MDFAEDLAPFFTDFGDAGTLAGRAVRGIFERNAATPTLGGMLVQHDGPAFLMAEASTQAGDDTATLVIPQGTYTVRRVEPVDDGLAMLLLKAAA